MSNAIPQAEIQIVPQAEASRMAFDWGELTWFANRELGNATTLTTGRCVIKPDCGNPRHYHPNCTEILTVISGQITHTGPDGEDAPMHPGDTVTIPPNIWHCAKNTGRENAVLMIVFDSADRQTIGE